MRPDRRIRPVRPYWSRGKTYTVVIGSILVSMLAATAWLQRSRHQVLELDPHGPYRFQSAAGPIAVSQAEVAMLHYDASWLITGPSLVDNRRGSEAGVGGGGQPLDLTVSCQTRFPCRAASRIELPASSELSVTSTGQDLSIDHFAGRLQATVVGDGDVLLGPVSGRISVAADRGGVFGYGLTARNVDIETAGGPVELRFASRPSRLSIRSGEGPVTIELPDGDYAVNVGGASMLVINVSQAADADSQILIRSRGPVRIDPTP